MSNHQETVLFSLSKYASWKSGQPFSVSDTAQFRGNLFLETAARATELGVPYYVADGNSSSDFRTELAAQSSVRILERIHDNQAQAFLYALDQIDASVQAIITTQGEKTNIVEHKDALTQSILEGSAHLVVGRREEGLFKATFPDYMYESETMANLAFNKMLDTAGLKPPGEFYDMFFGVIAWKHDPEVEAKIFHPYILDTANKDLFKYGLYKYLSPGVFVFYITSALASGLTVHSVEIPFHYGKQKENEALPENREQFMRKRISQRRAILTAECMAIAEFAKRNLRG
jgi:hypothetical protein